MAVSVLALAGAARRAARSSPGWSTPSPARAGRLRQRRRHSGATVTQATTGRSAVTVDRSTRRSGGGPLAAQASGVAAVVWQNLPGSLRHAHRRPSRGLGDRDLHRRGAQCGASAPAPRTSTSQSVAAEVRRQGTFVIVGVALAIAVVLLAVPSPWWSCRSAGEPAPAAAGASGPDALLMASHPPSTCGALAEHRGWAPWSGGWPARVPRSRLRRPRPPVPPPVPAPGRRRPGRGPAPVHGYPHGPRAPSGTSAATAPALRRGAGSAPRGCERRAARRPSRSSGRALRPRSLLRHLRSGDGRRRRRRGLQPARRRTPTRGLRGQHPQPDQAQPAERAAAAAQQGACAPSCAPAPSTAVAAAEAGAEDRAEALRLGRAADRQGGGQGRHPQEPGGQPQVPPDAPGRASRLEPPSSGPTA